jgi:alpha,alpha-trehalase
MFRRPAQFVPRLLLLLLAWAAFTSSSAPQQALDRQGLKPVLDYISAAWNTLTRSMTDCQSVVDPKVNTPSILYLPAGMTEPAAVQQLSHRCNVQVEHLPIKMGRVGEIGTSNIPPPGLLYLPNPYVVPGGRFNEMYGWDSYFIIRGLLLAGRIDLARGMVENFFFEIENYGAVLNANRTYYLTRSQPPFVSSTVVAVYEAMQKSGQVDTAWLTRAYSDLQKDYEMWNREPHVAGNTGLSRYFDFGEGPAAEALKDEAGYYRKVAEYFLLHPAQADHYIVKDEPELRTGERPDAPHAAGRVYSIRVCDVSNTVTQEGCGQPLPFRLGADYYKGDRSMRESGFDVSFRFGAFGAATHYFAPVCLNSLLYETEKNLEQISRWLGKVDDGKQWADRADHRRKLINQYLWDEKSGLFLDFNFQTGQRSSYRYATTFYPLWAGLATADQAKAVAKNISLFEKPGGLAMSTQETGAQWDLPYGWGNIEMLAVEGLRRFGFNADADRISYEFLSMVQENFRRDGNIREKYNVVARSSEAHAELGYPMNVVGFGWTNAAFLELLADLPPDFRGQLDKK